MCIFIHITYKQVQTDIHLDTHRGLTFVKSSDFLPFPLDLKSVQAETQCNCAKCTVNVSRFLECFESLLQLDALLSAVGKWIYK